MAEMRDRADRITATANLVVVDGIGMSRKIIAGQPVPPDLVSQYRRVMGRVEAARSRKPDSGEKPSSPPAQSTSRASRGPQGGRSGSKGSTGPRAGVRTRKTPEKG